MVMENSNSKNQINVYRNELKYYINSRDYEYLRYSFQKILHLDKYANENNEYWIRSLYFDSIQNNDYYDKMIGVKDRKKIRLRIYNSEQEMVKLEIKNKYSSYMLKETSMINREDSIELIKGNKSVLLKYGNEALNKAYYYMSKNYFRPAVIVDYEREAYTYPIQNIRITFDKNIRSNIVDFDFFNPNLNLISVFDSPTIVLEVKYNYLLPDWINEILSQINGEKAAISKYCMSRILF